MKIIIKFLLFIFLSNGFCQNHNEISPPENIKTIILQELGSEKQIPLIKFGKILDFSFDDINGDEADYYYKISHRNFDWSPSVLSKNEYINGMDDQHIQEYENSFNTLQLYSHFKLKIPNNDLSITKTGNYFLEIYDDNDEIVFSKKFIIYKNEAIISTEIKRSRNLNLINEQQIVQFSIKPKSNFFINPKNNVKTLIFKNNNIKNNITTLKPQYTIGNTLIYRYDQEASFWAGNEYLNFDNKNIRGGNISIQSFDLQDLYHNSIYTNRSRNNEPYTYNPDINGGFVVRNLNASNSNIEADYVNIHFSLENYENMSNQKIYVVGNFNNYILNEASELKYNSSKGIYENITLIKQGFVNYKFISFDGNKIDHSLIDGNFYQTENEYTILVYYKNQGDRYDKVIGIGSGSSINIRN